MSARLSRLEKLREEYSDLPPEVIVKEDLLRTGVAFSEAALVSASSFKPKAYFIFSFDLVPIRGMQRNEHLRAPEEIRLCGGPWEFRPVVVSVRLNPQSPYQVDLNEEDQPALFLEGEHLADVVFPEVPEYYSRTLTNGKPLTDMAPSIEWGYLLYLTVFRICQYFGRKEECLFCDINENYRQQRRSGRPYTAIKSVEEILEALEIVASTDSISRAYTITGGSVTSLLEDKTEVEFYLQYVEAIEGRFPGRWLSKIVVQALPKADLRRFREAGVRIYHPNYEVWDRSLFEKICPGKARYIGWETWIRRILEATDVFGPSHVIPNFVAGVEMARPWGFREIDQAIASTAEGLDFFMSRGVTPRFTTWCPEPLSVLGAQNPEGAPLEYHLRLLRVWRETLDKYRLAPPPGYGPAGIGRAVFSVSSFMDVAPANRSEDEPPWL